MKEWYLKKMAEAEKIEDAKNYAQMAGVEFDVQKWMFEKMLKQ